MTVVNMETGEIREPITLEAARRLTDRIKLLAGAVADGIDRLVERIHEAQASEVHIVLGYRSWAEYVEAEFAGLLPRLGREPRRELTTALAESGLPTRSIASVTGVSKSQVANDLSTSGQTNGPRTVHSRDGITRTFHSRPKAETNADDEFWSDAAERLKANGTVDKWDRERPYIGSVLSLSYAAEDVRGIEFAPEELAANIPETSRNRIPEITAMHEWLTRFLTALKETQ